MPFNVSHNVSHHTIVLKLEAIFLIICTGYYEITFFPKMWKLNRFHSNLTYCRPNLWSNMKQECVWKEAINKN
jgi:hypothetical protein